MTEDEYLNELTNEVEKITGKLKELLEYRNQILDLCESALTKVADASLPLGERLEEIASEMMTRKRGMLN